MMKKQNKDFEAGTIRALEVMRYDQAEAYWTQRGWGAKGPIKTASRIDVPRSFAKLATGKNVVAGVAWAQHRENRFPRKRVARCPKNRISKFLCAYRRSGD